MNAWHRRIFEKGREYSILILTFVIVVAALLAPYTVIRSEANHTRELVREHAGQQEAILQILEAIDEEEALREERTRKVLLAAMHGLSCVLLIDPQDRTPRMVEQCLDSALLEGADGT